MEKQIGEVTHYFHRIGVAALCLEDGLKIGDVVHIRGHTTDFAQPVASMEVDHRQIQSVGPRAHVAIKVDERVREGDAVYRISERPAVELGFGDSVAVNEWSAC
jgi:hypothetical protein